jgi:Uma2 family endonuclease
MSTRMEGWPRKHRITVEEYYRMAEIGVLAPDARVELIEGEIIDMPPIDSDHASVVDQLNHLLTGALGGQAVVRVQGPVRLSRSSEPEPDIALLKPRPDYYRHAHPAGADVLLVVEVSDSSLRYDCDVKVPLYARHDVPEVWIVDLAGERLHFYRSVADGVYRDHLVEAHPGAVSPISLPELTVDLSPVFAR